MCFSQLSSLCFSSIGFITFYRFYKNNYPFYYYLHICFYSFMEFLQFLQYFYVNECNSINNVLTKFAYILIWLQPIIYNSYYYLTNNRYLDVFRYNIILSLFLFYWAMDRMFFHIFHFNPPRLDEINVGNLTCTYLGNNHLYWKFNLNTNHGLEATYLSYMMFICLPAFWVDKWKKALYLNFTFLSGLILAYGYTRDLEEAISFWCLLSLPYLLISMIIPIKYMIE